MLIILCDKNGSEKECIELNNEQISQVVVATVLIVDGTYYSYRNMNKINLQRVHFQECEPPFSLR